MNHLSKLVLLLAVLSGCSSIGKGNLQGTADDMNWEIDGRQKVKVEFYEGGQIKSVEADNKAEPLIDISNITPTLENN